MPRAKRKHLRVTSRSRAAAVLAAYCLIALKTAGAAQDPPVFQVPVRCDMRAACFIQNYVDAEPGAAAQDHTCGSLTYDGHDGIDFRVPAGAHEPVAVLAAAAGIVRAARDGMADVSVKTIGTQAVAGREAGNAVVIVHENGWETQYSHLRRGSIAVRPGQTVETGALLGLVGLSGKTEFPHLHFSVRYQGMARDPFTGLAPGGGCGGGGESLWSPAAQQAVAYRPGGLLAAGFAAQAVNLETVLSESPAPPPTTGDGALLFWAASWGLRQGDVETIGIALPDGGVLSDDTAVVPGHKAQWLRYVGRKRTDTPWPSGRYRGDYRVTRLVNGAEVVIVEATRFVDVR